MIDHPYLRAIMLTDTIPCLAEPGKYIVTGKPSRPIDEVLPFLAALPNVIGFNPETLTLTFRRPRGFMTLYPNRISITQVRDAEEGLELFAALTEAINATWDSRNAIKPLITRKKPAGPLDVYALLPRTNCKQCGEATCWSFASKLVMSQKDLSECPLLTESEHQANLAALQTIILDAPANY